MGLVSQMYYNSSAGETVANAKERIVLVGGFGGYPSTSDPRLVKWGLRYCTCPTISLDPSLSVSYDGIATRPDVWSTYDGGNWTLITSNAYFGPRAWMGITVWHKDGDPTQDASKAADGMVPRLWVSFRRRRQSRSFQAHLMLFIFHILQIFGGGQMGSLTTSKQRFLSMRGLGDSYWSRDGLNWIVRINILILINQYFYYWLKFIFINEQKENFEEGGGSTFCTYYSSEEWTQTTVAGAAVFLGMWGHTATYFEPPALGGRLLILGGQYDQAGPFSSGALISREGLLCNLNGIPCNKK